MKIIRPWFEIITPIQATDVMRRIEEIGRTCYKSEAKITEGSAAKFVHNLIRSGHESVLEHCTISVRFTVDRGVSHEIVRHRLASYSQESTRYCNYGQDKFGNEITVIAPCYLKVDSPAYLIWKTACESCELAYLALLDQGCTPQEARSVLPNSLKTELVMTANIREWRHFLKLRCSKAAHPQIREVAIGLRNQLIDLLPHLFEDLVEVD